MAGTFEAELALDRLEAELATELPAHIRAFAASYAAGRSAPAAPESARRPGSIEIARKALAVPSEVASRAIAMLRLLIPIAIEDDPRVAVARAAERSWESWSVLAATRDAAATSRFGVGHIPLLHELHGSGAAAPTAAWPEPLPGWHDQMPPIQPRTVEHAWRDLAAWHGAKGSCRIVHAAARPRTFIVEPGREVIVVVGPIDTPAMQFATIHELGHAVAALIVPRPLARVVDEAVAAYTARLIEHEGTLDLDWFAPIATPARARRRQLSAALGAIERGGPDRPTPTPTSSLWHDPAAQAAYVAAEAIADRWWAELGAAPPPGALADAIVTEQRRIDQAGSTLIA